MASSLAQQLSRIQVADRAGRSEKSQLFRDSFLFDPRQAANLDLQTIFDIGQDGLSELCKMNSRFSFYSKTLFSEAVKSMDRILQTKKENDILDASIQSFLRELAPYFQTKSAGKALEWLIRRFRINEFNVRDTVAAFIPYHETKAFLSLLTVLHFSPADMKTFKFLATQRKSRQLLDRHTLVQQCIHDRSVLAFISDAVIATVKCNQSYPTLLSFYATLFSQYIGDLPNVNDHAIQFIAPYIVKGMESGNADAQLASYLILESLSCRVAFSKDMLEELIPAMNKTSLNTRATVLSIAQLVQSQKTLAVEFPPKAASSLSLLDKFEETFASIEQEFDLSVLKFALVSSLAKSSFSDIESSKLLHCIVTTLSISEEASFQALGALLLGYLERDFENLKSKNGSDGDEVLQSGCEVLYLFQSRFPATFKKCIGDLMNQIAGNTGNMSKSFVNFASTKLYDLASKDSSGDVGFAVPLKNTRETLLTSLTHAESGIRLAAVKHVMSILKGKDTLQFKITNEEIASLLIGRLSDDDDNVVRETLSYNWAEYADPAALLDKLSAVLAIPQPRLMPFSDGLFKLLVSPAILEDKDRQVRVVSVIFPYLLAIKENIRFTKSLLNVLKTSSLNSSGALRKIEILVSEVEGKDDSKLWEKYNKKIVALISKNAFDGESSIGENMLIEKSALSTPEAALLMLLAASKKIVDGQSEKDSKFYSMVNALVQESISLLNSEADSEPDNNTKALSVGKSSNIKPLMTLVYKAGASTLAQKAAGIYVLLTLSSQLQPKKEMLADGWLPRQISESKPSKYHRDFVTKMYTHIVSDPKPMTVVDSAIIANIFEHQLNGEWVQFLSSQWLDTSDSSLVRSRSLIIFQAFLASRTSDENVNKSSLIDYQVVLPALMIALADSNNTIRVAACECLKVLETIYEKMPKKSKSRKSLSGVDVQVYKHDAFYGHQRSTELQFIPTYVSLSLVSALVSKISEISNDPLFLKKFLGRILSEGSKHHKPLGKYYAEAQNLVPTFLLSHVVAMHSAIPQFQSALLGLISQVETQAKFAMLVPLLSKHIDAIRKNDIPPAPKSDKEVILIEYLTAIFNNCADSQLDNSEAWSLASSLIKGPSIKDSLGNENWSEKYTCDLYLQKEVLGLLSLKFLSSLRPDQQRELVHILITLASKHGHNLGADVVNLIKTTFERLPLDPGLPAQDIAQFAKELQELTGQAIHQNKKQRPSSLESKKSNVSGLIYNISSYLEFIQGKQEVSQSPLLTLPLFSLLNGLVSIGADVSGEASQEKVVIQQPLAPTEYTKQLIIEILLRIFRETTPRGIVIDEAILRVDSLVQVIRTSTSPQTHNQSLLLLSAIAEQHPQLVLHHIMAIFTFMGANVLRQDDNYSFHVIQQTIEKIIPPLVKSASPNVGDDQDAVPTEIIKKIFPVFNVFVDSLTHIPRHRRLILFASVVKTVGAKDYLYIMLALLIEKEVARLSKLSSLQSSQPAEKSSATKDRDSVLEFALALSLQFDPSSQLRALVMIQKDLLLLPAEKPPRDQLSEYTIKSGIVDLTRASTKSLRNYKISVLQFVKELLTNSQFVNKLHEDANTEHSGTDSMLDVTNERLFTRLIETDLQVISYIGIQYAQVSSAKSLTSSVESVWKLTLQEAYAVLDAASHQLELSHFVLMVKELITHDNKSIRRRVLDLTNKRVEDTRNLRDSEKVAAQVLTLLHPLQGVLNAESSTETATNKQAALLCITTITKYFAVSHPAAFNNVFAAVIGNGGLSNPNPHVVASAMACLTHLCLVLGPRAVSTLPKYMPIVLKHLSSGVTNYPTASNSDLTLLVGALSVVDAIVKKMSQFVHPSLPTLLSSLMHPAIAVKEESAQPDNSENSSDEKLREHVRIKASSVLSAIAQSVSPRHLLPAQFGYFQKEALVNGTKSIVPLLEFVGLTASSMSRQTMEKFYKPMFKFFLIVFDTRRLHGNSLSAEDIEEIESATLDAFIKFVIKLNEKTFKPLFLGFVDWATTSQQIQEANNTDSENNNGDDDGTDINKPSQARLIPFYRAVNKLFESLRSLATPYYSSIMDLTVSQLERYAIRGDSIEVEEENRRKDVPAIDHLWIEVVKSIHICALHDTTNLWNSDVLAKISKPLADQVPNTRIAGITDTTDSTDVYISRIKDILAPTFGQLAVAAGNDASWKMFNSRVLLKSRSEDPATRLGSLYILQEFYNKLGEEFLILLPETIPFLAELMEDDDHRVERLTQETIHLIESYLGESLQSYFK
ncbi:snoRNA-binding rRNA-processing protein utp10 [Mycoemilia scoparia]|uniref:U3 small nucleolar RNA-associated protein 10 n=1 Tax=Mycoemilia scoparia TaxID=417184 RepID=A0A9W8DRD2_9FUNG|nr:snoRNA-binding rRNA-processing protein utp10 [Mycoemilia scoparia]